MSGPSRDLGRIPAVRHARLSPEDLAQLPAGAPAPPWTCEVEATVWWHRAPRGAGALLPAPLVEQAGPRVTLVMLVRYLDSPVGPYAEVVAAPRLLRPRPGAGLVRAHVPFIAVDDLASIAGGRAGWALPKTVARFGGPPGEAPVRAQGPGWWVRGEPLEPGRALPVAVGVTLAQVDADGVVHAAAVRLRGRARRARVDVDVDRHSGLDQWLRPGAHRGVVCSGRLRIGAPRALS